jgi:hypothetical protein
LILHREGDAQFARLRAKTRRAVNGNSLTGGQTVLPADTGADEADVTAQRL